MKEFILKQKYNILFILTVISDIVFDLQALAEIPSKWHIWIKIMGIIVIVLINKVQKFNADNLEEYHKGLVSSKTSRLPFKRYNIFTYTWYLLKNTF